MKLPMLKLTVCITYSPSRGAQFLDLPKSDMAICLRADLDLFRLPHPPMVNIETPTMDRIEFFYTTRENSPLFNIVRKIFSLRDSAIVNMFCILAVIEDLPPPRRLSMPEPQFRHRVHTESQGRSDRHEYSSFAMKDLSSASQKDIYAHFFPDSLNVPQLGKPASNDSAAPNDASTLVRLTREYWDTRRNIAAAAARGDFIEQQLRLLGATVAAKEEMHRYESLDSQLKRLEIETKEERARRKMAEVILEEVRRECEEPLIIPKLLKMWDCEMVL
ncbi:hypothetical protein C8J57DRAFT_1717660 [Mycena rebaudengoi]|nr:hypothetical protein C8J57DRAFT_1717660 [Mycena rebaudengoi]